MALLNFFLGFLLFSIIFILVAFKLLTLILRTVVGASVGLRVGGLNSIRDVVVKLKKGAIESVSVGEIKLSLFRSSINLGVDFHSRGPKLQVSISGLEVVMRSSRKSKDKSKSKSSGKPKKSHKPGLGKLIAVAKIARYLSLCLRDLVVKTPKATVQLKELKVNVLKDNESKSNLSVKQSLYAILVQLSEPQVSFDQLSNSNDGGSIVSSQSSVAMTERSGAPISCESFSLICEFGHDREVGVAFRNVDISFGDITVSLNEEMLSNKKPASDTTSDTASESNRDEVSTAEKKAQKKQQTLQAISKYSIMFPEKVCFNLQKLGVRFMHRGHGISAENNIMGIQLKTIKSSASDNATESTRLEVQLVFCEIHLLQEADDSVLEISKIDIVSFVCIPKEPTSPIKAETDIKLGGTRCMIIMSRLKPWLQLHFSKKKKMVLREENKNPKPQVTETNSAIMWTFAFSAPEMTIVVFNLGGLPVFQACTQSFHLFANNMSKMGTVIRMDLGELNLTMSNENRDSLMERFVGVDSNSGSILQITKVSLDLGKKKESSDEGGSMNKQVLTVDVTGMGVYFTYKRVESLVSTAILYQALMKSLIPQKTTKTQNQGHAPKSSGKGAQLLKFNLEKCSVNFCGHAGLESAIVLDPKRVNYGSQGGRVIITESSDGTPRTASFMSTVSDEHQKLKYCISLDIFHLSVSANKEKKSTQVELESARSVYQECLEESMPITKVLFLDIQNAKFVQRAGVAICSLFSAKDIAVRWEPDLHLSLIELVLHLKLMVHNAKLQKLGNVHFETAATVKDVDKKSDTMTEPGNSGKHKKDPIFALDVEMLHISAEVGDGVEAMVQVQSIFSENARIGVLLEGFMVSLCGARLLKSRRMQISRIPNITTSASDPKVTETTWDFVIQGLDVHIYMPFGLQLRAIDDAVEEMIRGLKLITTGRTNILFPIKKSSSKAKTSGSKFGRVKFCLRKITAEIEEEPIQGWLDEHFHLIRKEASELAVRLNFLDEFISNCKQSPKSAETSTSTEERKFLFDGVEIDVDDASNVNNLREEIYKRSFQEYYQACQNIVPSEGSGACNEGFQAGFKPSTARTSVLSLAAADLEVSLTKIDGGEDGMIDILKKLDPVCRENNIPFSRLYGQNMRLKTASIVVQLRNYTSPLLSATSARCEGCLVMAQQATPFQPQMCRDVYVGKWRKVTMLRSATGTTPPMKTYLDLPVHFQKVEAGFGVGYEPVFADVSYAFTVALRRANLSVRDPNPWVPPPKIEKSLPWWDEMRNYIHGNIGLFITESRLNVLATTDPYENLDKLQIVSGPMEIRQSDGKISVSVEAFKVFISSLETMAIRRGLTLPAGVAGPILEAPLFTVEVTMDWGCDSGNPLDHYLFALPVEGMPRERVFDPFRSTSLSLKWNLSLRPLAKSSQKQSSSGAGLDVTAGGLPHKSGSIPLADSIINVGAHDLAWIIKFWNLNNIPPHKLRFFSRWPRFGVPRIARSGNLPLDRVMTEFFLRIDAFPLCIKNMPLDDDDPAKGLTFTMTKFKFETCSSRGKQNFTFDCKREPLDAVYLGLDLHMPKAFFNKEAGTSVAKLIQLTKKSLESTSAESTASEEDKDADTCSEKNRDDGFFFSSSYFSIRKQAPKGDHDSLIVWQEAGKRNLEMTCARSEYENDSDSPKSDQSDDEGYNVVIADNCQRFFLYGLKILWNIENRDAVRSWVGSLSKAFAPSKPSPSRQYAQRKLREERQLSDGAETAQGDAAKSGSSVQSTSSPPSENPETSESQATLAPAPAKADDSFPGTMVNLKEPGHEDGTRHFMVNVIEPQFNLHSEDANGRFLLAAVSGRLLARSFHSVIHVGKEMFEQALNTTNGQIPECEPQMTWKRTELSVMLEHVQAHVAPTDVDLGAGIQWLPKIRKSSPKVKRTGALLERVFMPCDMYIRYTRHKGGTPELKVKPLKELAFNSQNITATMTSRQFQVMLDVLINLLFARMPKPRKSTLSFPVEDDEDDEEEADAVVPDGVEEVELARVNLEVKERRKRLIMDDIRKLSLLCDTSGDSTTEKEGDMWILACGKPILVQKLNLELVNAQKSRKEASALLRTALQKAAQQRLIEKEKNKSPSYAMRVSLQINKVIWSMIVDGKSFAEVEINDLIYDFDRDYKDIGVARFTTKYIVIRNGLPNAKCDMLLSAWNPPSEWGKKVMLRVDAKQGTPKDGNPSPLELLQVEVYPLKIHLTESMYTVMWGYLFPEEGQDSVRRQEVWKVSTTAAGKRGKKGDASASGNRATDAPSKSTQLSNPSKTDHQKTNSQSFDRSWEETVAESVANELVLHSMSKGFGSIDLDEASKGKPKDSKLTKSAQPAIDDKKVAKTIDDKKPKPKKLREFHNIKISQVELCLSYEGSRFAVSELKLLMDEFHRVEFTGTWQRLFARVKKHIIWGVLKSVTGMQGKKFKDKGQPSGTVPELDLTPIDNEGQEGKTDQNVAWPKRPTDGAGDGFVTSVKGLFNTQRQKAKQFVLKTMRGEENDGAGDLDENDADSTFARQLTISKAKKLIRRHTKKFQSKQKDSNSQQDPPSPTNNYFSDSSSGSSPDDIDFNIEATAGSKA